MATRFVVCVQDGQVLSNDNSDYTAARNGTGTLSSTEDQQQIGQQLAATWNVWEAFFRFDLAGLLGVTISSATLLGMSNNTDESGTDFTINVRSYDWSGVGITNSAFRAGSTLSTYTLLATYNTASGFAPSAYYAFTDVAMASALQSALGGSAYMFASSSRQESGTAPSANEFVYVKNNGQSLVEGGPWRLTIVDNTTQSSQTINTGTSTFTPSQTSTHDVECIGGGSRSAASTSQEGGGHGGGWAFGTHDCTSGVNVTVSVGAAQTTNGSGGNDTWWQSFSGIRGSGGVVPTVVSLGLVWFPGGLGAGAQGGGGSRGGSGGGSSAGPMAFGVAGTAGSGSSGGAGATAPTGGGNGGNGGASAASGQDGVVPGGGSGGGGNSGGNAGNGAAGRIIVYWYVIPAPTPRRQPVIRGVAVHRSHHW